MAVVLGDVEVTRPSMNEIELAAGVAIVAGRGAAATGRHFPLSFCFLDEIVRLLLKRHERPLLLYLKAAPLPIRRRRVRRVTATHLG